MEAVGIKIGDTVFLQDRFGDHLGTLHIEELRYGAWCGTFQPGPAYNSVRDLFAEWTRLLNDQCLGSLDDLDRKISEVGIRARIGETYIPFEDVQIYDHTQGCLKLVR
jgi:hypothetical protein